MTTLTKKKLLGDLRDKETRELFAAEHITTGLPFQIHGLREKLGITQAELARRAGMAQERISVLEDPNYEFIPKINTLLKLANVFDVPLIVRFGSWKELFGWEIELSPEKLAPPTFEEELEELEEAAATDTAAWIWEGAEFKVTYYHTRQSLDVAPHAAPIVRVNSSRANYFLTDDWVTDIEVGEDTEEDTLFEPVQPPVLTPIEISSTYLM